MIKLFLLFLISNNCFEKSNTIVEMIDLHIKECSEIVLDESKCEVYTFYIDTAIEKYNEACPEYDKSC